MRAPWLRGLRRCQGTYLASQGARRFVQCIRFAKSTSLPWWLAYASAPRLAFARFLATLVSIHYAYLYPSIRRGFFLSVMYLVDLFLI